MKLPYEAIAFAGVFLFCKNNTLPVEVLLVNSDFLTSRKFSCRYLYLIYSKLYLLLLNINNLQIKYGKFAILETAKFAIWTL